MNIFWFFFERFFKNKIGSIKWQSFWDRMFKYSLNGLNIGGGTEFSESGELVVLDLFKKNGFLHEDSIIFDVGANVGQYSMELFKMFPDSKIYSFEPSYKTYEKLCSNVGTKNIVTKNIGLGEEEGKKILYSDSNCSGMASLYKRDLDYINIEFHNEEKVCIERLDEFCKREKISSINFLKIDVEGNELSVIKSAGEMIANKSIDIIQIEFGGTDIDSRVFFKDFWYLLEHRYNIYRIVRDGLVQIEEYSELLEIFTCVNYVFVRKELSFCS